MKIDKENTQVSGGEAKRIELARLLLQDITLGEFFQRLIKKR